MTTTDHRYDPAIVDAVDSLHRAISSVVGSAPIGLYLFGSLATSDFDADISDIDLIAVLTEPPDEQLVERLRRLHQDVVSRMPEWDDRIEVIYISEHGLAHCRTETTTIAVISPGEPLHAVEAGREWVLNWYPAREKAIVLSGPPIENVIPPIPEHEYIDELRQYLRSFDGWIGEDSTLGDQAYAILSICRGLYTMRQGDRPSKREAAAWAQQAFPEWADLIRRALGWRDRQRGQIEVDDRA